ncbi:unnamed protein product [Parascedosporium putredinis]|uniref:Cryptochrome/DNA photolyase FAD-binding domain-containing protein n=1 Tax=Parascedosporium putredinis TaxID=1442378 RepID=A0A9P1MCK7_9PEZI|nr:unnamed protein product [Parascedosporium putredinis]CAI8001826.1 unnamed protein product [Parascedosporium putredinis]
MGSPRPRELRPPRHPRPAAAQPRLGARRLCDEDLEDYAEERNTPARAATSRISAYLAVGAISARTCVSTAQDRNTTRKLDQGPLIEFSNVEWVYNKDHFAAWCEGRTGYPIVDAAMRQLHHMGWMHNRCRMIVACFLAKDLLLDWRMGERYFMEHLIDGDFASNNGGWGFSASVGADPQPYFRIFNPLLQSEKFDPDGAYIREWVPELADVPAGDPAVHDPHDGPTRATF